MGNRQGQTLRSLPGIYKRNLVNNSPAEDPAADPISRQHKTPGSHRRRSQQELK
jgi:hypothetical protein